MRALRLRTVFWLLVAALLVLNFSDFATTWFGITYRGDLESNSFMLMLGGPFSPMSILLKLVIVPGLILSGAWWLNHKFKDPLPAMAILISPAVVFASAVANNVVVMTKKVQKIAGRNQPSPEEVTKT